MKNLNLEDLFALRDAIRDVTDYVTDNSCSDPDCCGGPFSSVEDYEEGERTLASYGLYLKANI